MIGQFTNDQFLANYPNAQIDAHKGWASTRYGQDTINYWTQHSDGSWTNYDCKTVPGLSLRF